jgi:hypothetical protein
VTRFGIALPGGGGAVTNVVVDLEQRAPSPAGAR